MCKAFAHMPNSELHLYSTLCNDYISSFLPGFHGIELLAAADLEQNNIPITDKEQSHLVLESDNDDSTLRQHVVETDVHADATSYLRGLAIDIDSKALVDSTSGTERNESRRVAAKKNAQNNGLPQQLDKWREESLSDHKDLWDAISTISLTPGPKGDQGEIGPQGPKGVFLLIELVWMPIYIYVNSTTCILFLASLKIYSKSSSTNRR